MISSTDLAILGCLVVITTVIPLLMLRGERARWGFAEACFWIFMTLGFTTTRLFEVPLSGMLLFGIVFVIRVVMFVGLVLTADEYTLRWSSTRAGIASAIVYLLLIPHVLQVPIDGDEPYFLLVTESIVTDGDLDLANQYETLETSATRRLDLEPQLGDPVGEQGQIYSRHEPFLSVVLIPGYLIGGLYGAAATIALLAALLIVSLLKLVEQSGLARMHRSLLWPAVALGPPVLFYATRLWAEVPGALAYSEAIRAMRSRRWGRFAAWLLVLSLLQLRFGVLAAGLLVVAIVGNRPPLKRIAVGLLALLVPFVVIWISTGRLLGVHQTFELLPMNPVHYLRGMAGLLVDAQAGLLFQAPFWLLGILALFRKQDRAAVGLLWLAATPYLLLLVPRAEWHGGWSPPLRYLVVFAPLIALSLGRVLMWVPRPVQALAAVWTTGIVIHGIAFPWRLFQIASGESVLAAALSSASGFDFSRLFPSLIRFNTASLVWLGLVLIGGLVLASSHSRTRPAVVGLVLCFVITTMSVMAKDPGTIVELEDAHVRRVGGELYPEQWTVARFRFRGGWLMTEGASAHFRMKPGFATIDYMSEEGVMIDVGGRRWALAPTDGFGSAVISIPDQEVELKIVRGSAVIDRVTHE